MKQNVKNGIERQDDDQRRNTEEDIAFEAAKYGFPFLSFSYSICWFRLFARIKSSYKTKSCYPITQAYFLFPIILIPHQQRG